MANEIANGRFVLLHPLGEGSQGVTFDGVDKREGRPVAIKRFDVRGARAWKDVELAEREARVLQSLRHPTLPAYIDHFEEDGALYLVMEKIDGESLAALRKRDAPFGDGDATRLLEDASGMLDYLHGRNPPVIHRDLKPGNVIRRPDGSFAFVDFGSVRDRLRPKGGSTVVGTFGYMAPEQMQGRAMPASDVYAVGATVVSMLTGTEPEDLPHRGLAIDVRAALRGTRTSERTIAALERMLDPDPDRRASRIAPLLRGGSARPPPAVGVADGWHEQLTAELDRRAQRVARRVERATRHAARRAAHAARHAAGEAAHAARHAAGEAAHAARHAAGEAEYAARQAAAGAEHGARRAARRRRSSSSHRLPGPVRLLFMLGLIVGTIAVALATQVIVPIVLTLLSLLFARRSLIAAARAVRRGGQVAMASMHTSQRWIRGEQRAQRDVSDGSATDDGGVRVAETDTGDELRRARVAVGDVKSARSDDEREDDEAEAEAERGSRS